ncbi:hypothetical protein KDK77_04700 [bacterium]|nr:hypothetical protein [bacterium]MCP5462619.1 hypothetical protein [bacterium]
MAFESLFQARVSFRRSINFHSKHSTDLLDRFTRPSLALINTHYTLDQEIMGYYFYKRKEE